MKFVISTTLGETTNVNTAAVDCPGKSLVPSWFHVRVIGPLAVVGTQPVGTILKTRDTPVPSVFDVYCFGDICSWQW